MKCSQCGFEHESPFRFAREDAFPEPVCRGCLPYYTVEAGRIVLIDVRPPHDSPTEAGDGDE